MAAQEPEIITSKEQMRRWSRAMRAQGKIIGLVPTMGYLHKGHLSLINEAHKLASVIVVSIYVNPSQFSTSEDISTYPSDLKGDLQKLMSVDGGVDVVFNPYDLYDYGKARNRGGIQKRDNNVGEISCLEERGGGHETWVRVENLEKGLCGKSRPLFFRGVATVVSKLFNIVEPDVAIFGKKDYQQWRIICRMGDLRGYLEKKGRLKPSKSLKFALDIARGINNLHVCKPDPVIHCNLMPKNILLDSGGQLKVAGFGLLRLSKISADKFQLADPGAGNRNASVYTAPELYNEEIFDKSVDAFSFAVILYEMIEGVYPFHPKPAEEAIKIMCVEHKRPTFKKLKNYPSELKELIELCWSGEPSLRPSFAEIILRLDAVVAHGWKHGWWKDTFKLPWL